MLNAWIDQVVIFLGLHPDSRIGAVVQFFLYDSIKIIVLIFGMITVIGFFRSFMPQDKVRDWISHKNFLAYIVASLFGAITPFCSCSSIPIFLGFLRCGVPLGVNFAFLITSPIINEYLVVLMLGFFGWKITLFYVLSGLVIGTSVGMVLGRMKLDDLIEEDMKMGVCETPEFRKFSSLKARILSGASEAWDIVKSIWHWVLLGVGIGAVIHNYVPEQAVQALIGRTGLFSVPLAVLIGVPIYANCVAIVPVAVALFQKGIPLGTALAFMMATAALSLPEAILLRRAMKLKLIALFFGITALAIVFTGYLVNFLQPLLTD